MKHKIITLTFLLIGLIAFAQHDCEVDSTIVEKGRDVKGLWYMSDFKNPNFIKTNKTGTHNNRFIVNFLDNNKLSIRSGNSFGGNYYSIDSSKIQFDLCIQTLAYVTYKAKRGKMIDAGLFVDSLLSCNNYIGSDQQMYFYRDDDYIMTLTCYKNLIPLPQREDFEEKRIEIIILDSANIDNDYTIVNDSNQLNSLGIKKTIDFENHSLLVVKNKSLQQNKKLFRKVKYKWRRRFKNDKFPYTYAQLHFDKENDKYYLDILSSFYTGTRYHLKQKGQYIGLIIDKVSTDNIEINRQIKI